METDKQVVALAADGHKKDRHNGRPIIINVGNTRSGSRGRGCRRGSPPLFRDDLLIFQRGKESVCGKFCIFAPDITKAMRQNVIMALTSNTSIKKRGHLRVNIRLSLQKCKGSQLVFCPHAADGQAARTELQKFLNQ